MRIGEIKYYFTSIEKMRKRQKEISKLLDTEFDQKKRIKLINEEFDMLKALIRRNKNDKDFMKYVNNSSIDFIKKYADYLRKD